MNIYHLLSHGLRNFSWPSWPHAPWCSPWSRDRRDGDFSRDVFNGPCSVETRSICCIFEALRKWKLHQEIRKLMKMMFGVLEVSAVLQRLWAMSPPVHKWCAVNIDLLSDATTSLSLCADPLLLNLTFLRFRKHTAVSPRDVFIH